MARNLVTVDDVKKALNIESFRNISREKIMEFVSLIPSMDKDIAIAIINQFPTYAEMAADMVQCMCAMCDKALESNNDTQKEAIAAYKMVLKSLTKLLEKDTITEEEREVITEKMIEVADKISTKDTENKKFIQDILRYGSSIVGGLAVLGVCILGVNTAGKNIPKLRN